MALYPPPLRSFFAASALCASLALPFGCDRKEKILDIETPNGDIEVERSKDTGKVDVEVDVDHK